MRIDTKAIDRILRILKDRDESKKGVQPEMVLSCFRDLEREEDKAPQVAEVTATVIAI